MTAWLTYALADYMVDYRKRHNGKTSRLYEYLGSVYNVEDAALDAASKQWRKFLKTAGSSLPSPIFLPSIIEILSIIDIALAEAWSFGPSRRPRDGRGIAFRELVGNELRRVRERAIEALVIAFRQLHQRRSNDLVVKLASQFQEHDSIVTTNWDILLDDAILVCTRAPPNYGAPGARLVDLSGRDLPNQCIAGARSLLKLHGSFNWLHCPRCSDLYINTQLMITPERDLRGRFPYDLTCDCGAELSGLIVTPSYVKEYRNLHLANVWRLSQKALEESDEWLFVGYSLPDDDLHIRGMLLRSLTIRRGRRKRTKITVISHRKDELLQGRYFQLFSDADLQFLTNGLGGWMS